MQLVLRYVRPVERARCRMPGWRFAKFALARNDPLRFQDCAHRELATTAAKPETGLASDMAEGQGFEPWEVLPSLVFKTSAFDRSATPPKAANNDDLPNGSQYQDANYSS